MKLLLALLLAAPLAGVCGAAQKPSLRRRSPLDEGAQRAPFAASALRQPSGALLSRVRGGERMGLMPVYKKEMPMFFTFAFMMFCTIFIFTMARDTKDTLVVTSAGAEAIAFLKVYFVIPASMLFFLLYSKMSNVLSKRVLFASTMLPFIAFYALFGFVLYPLRDSIHLKEFANVPEGISYLFKLAQFWSFTLYYIVSELFGSVGVPLLFWQTANDLVGVEQAKRWYPLFSTFGNLGPIVAGQTSAFVNARFDYEAGLRILTVLMVAAGAGSLLSFFGVQRMADTERANKAMALADSAARLTAAAPAGNLAAPAATVAKKKKPKLSMAQSLALLARSEYLGLVCVLVLSYGLSIEFTEIMWKAVIKKYLPAKSDYMRFMGQYSTAVGVTTLLMTLVGSQIPKRFGWKAGAMVTPVVIGSLSWIFFAYITFGNVESAPSALKMAVIVGTVQNVLSKAVKYALFDPTKEMAYIPLDEDSKQKGKAAIDVLGARLGKSGGALIQQAIVVYTGSILGGAPLIAALFSCVIVAWIASVNKLSVLFQAKLKAMQSAEAE
ncbi:ADP/ATP carrier protein [Pavlovales sp. CCMP2436]|nr:ADP/ATP carrier protein [Pavlovales sp. CCMP2436]